MTPPRTVLANDALAASNLPATNNAAVDGYAVDAFSRGQPAHEFNIIGKAAAGHPSGLLARETVRIFTGAVMPTARMPLPCRNSVTPTM